MSVGWMDLAEAAVRLTEARCLAAAWDVWLGEGAWC